MAASRSATPVAVRRARRGSTVIHEAPAEWIEQQTAKHDAEVAVIEAQAAEADQDLHGWNWVPDDAEGYKPAEFQGEGGDGMLVYHPLGDAAPRSFSALDVGPPILSMASLRRPVEDMVKMEEVNEPAVLNNVRERFHRQQIYTNIGERKASLAAQGGLGSFAAVL